MTLELNASDDRGINIVRNEIQDFASTRTIFSNKFKLIILDECDAMTKDAQMALRRVMEKYVRNARFCLICNYVSKIIPALQSRCTRFRFQPLPEQFVRTRLDAICSEEHITTTTDGIDALIELGAGDMRRTLNLLQSTYMSASEISISEEGVYGTAGKPLPSDIASCAHWLLNEPLHIAFNSTLMVSLSFFFFFACIYAHTHTQLIDIFLLLACRNIGITKEQGCRTRGHPATAPPLCI